MAGASAAGRAPGTLLKFWPATERAGGLNHEIIVVSCPAMAIRTLLCFLLFGILCTLAGLVVFLFLGTWL